MILHLVAFDPGLYVVETAMAGASVLVAFDPGLYAVETAMTGALVPKQLSGCTDIKLCNRDDLIATVGGLRSNHN